MGASDHGGLPIAPTEGQAVDLGAPITVRVTARDLSGMPLAGATVRAIVDGTPTGSTLTTDATGLATLTTTYRASLAVRADLTGFDSATCPIVATASEVFVTPRLRRPFALGHPYAWQNRVMRERLFREHPEDRDDPGTAPTPDARDRKDRTERLLSISEYLGGALGIAQPTASTVAVDAERQRLRDVQTNLDRLETASADGGSAGLDNEGEQALVSSRAGVGLDTSRPAPPPPRRHREPRTDRLDRARERAAILEAREIVEGRLQRINEVAISHREVLDHLVNRVFPAAPPGAIAGWLKYMIIHFAGLRYVNANNSYYWPKKILSGLRAREIDAGEIGADAERLRIYVGEADALVAALGTSAPRAITTALGQVHRHAADASAPPIGALKTLHAALADLWCASMTDNEIFGLLRLRSQGAPPVASSGRLSPSEWTWIQTHTQLRNDLTTWDESVRKPGFLRDDMGAWKDRQGVDLVPAPWGAECNQIAEMAAQSRGFEMQGGIAHDAECSVFAPRSADGLSTDGGPLIGSLKTRATSVGADTKTLWRPASTAELSQGDVFFKMQWESVGVTHDRSGNRVFPTLDMVFAVGRAYAPNDPLPSMHAVRTGSHIRATAVPGNITGPLTVLNIDDLENIDEALLMAPPAADEFQPDEAHRGRFLPIDRPLPAAEAGDSRPLYAKCGERIVRRHPGAAAYHDVLVWYHIGTVVATDATRVYTFETAAPTGMKRWLFGGTSSSPGLLGSWEARDATYTVFGRPSTQADHAAVARHIHPSVLFAPYLED
ncbi:hypothetical protein A7982_13784 [Minicystis rosea]|nr:hypothetical protein A7982_13784 [Minicystis rosea]